MNSKTKGPFPPFHHVHDLLEALNQAGLDAIHGEQNVSIAHEEQAIGGWNKKVEHWYINGAIARGNEPMLKDLGFSTHTRKDGRDVRWVRKGEGSSQAMYLAVSERVDRKGPERDAAEWALASVVPIGRVRPPTFDLHSSLLLPANATRGPSGPRGTPGETGTDPEERRPGVDLGDQPAHQSGQRIHDAAILWAPSFL